MLVRSGFQVSITGVNMLTCYYDLAVSPPTYETVSFTMRSDQERVRLGEDSLQVIILPGSVGGFRQDRLWPFSIEERRAVLRDIVIPICHLLPSCVSVTTVDNRPPRIEPSFGYSKAFYGLNVFVSSYKSGFRPLRCQLTNYLFRNKLVTITLREAEHWPHRNSNVDEWLEAAFVIQQLGYNVIIIRDFCKADKKFSEFTTYPAASRDISVRAQLYASAVANLGISNGPMWLALAMDAPVLMLRPVMQKTFSVFGSSHFARAGITVGGQLPGAPSHQVLVWEEDTSKTIVDSFKRFIDRKEAAA